MGKPFISVRKHIRWSSGEAKEPTSTLVLSSKGDHFVDVRILLEASRAEDGQPPASTPPLEWAFAGHTSISAEQKDDTGVLKTWHSTWHHFVDSNSDEPDKDEGDMFLQEDGTVLEKGAMTNPATGAREDYEELWEDLDAQPTGPSKKIKCTVLRRGKADGPHATKGMVIRLGTWCQGIMKEDGGQLTVERWQWRHDGEVQQQQHPPAGGDVQLDEAGMWICTFRVGSGILPCRALCSESLGHDTTIQKLRDKTYDGWDIIEDFTL